MAKAVFLDRDGVLCKLVFNKKTKEYEAAHSIRNLKLLPNAIKYLSTLQKRSNYLLFLVSNQPDVAKGKTTMASLKKVHKKFDRMLTSNGIHFKHYYYCYHHPKGIVPFYTKVCECRKPGALSLFKASKAFNVNLSDSWMVGDMDIDIGCGKNAGTRTIMVKNTDLKNQTHKNRPDYIVKNVAGAVKIILSS